MRVAIRLLGVVTVLVVLAAPATATAGKKAIWGPFTMPDGTSAFPVYDELGVDVLQVGIVWSRVAPARPAHPRDPNDPAYRFLGSLDAAVAEARRHGIDLLFLVRSTPPWANGGQATNVAPRDPDDYADFMTALARRYPRVRYYMVWGETNFGGGASFSPMPDNSRTGPRRYAVLLDRAYVALKRVSRRIKVIGGNTLSVGGVSPRDFVRWMRMPNGRRPRLDWYGHNPYSRRFPDITQSPLPGGFRDLDDVDTFAREVDRSFPGKRLWLSEYTVSSDRANRAFDFFVTRPEQAEWLAAAFRIARARSVAGLGWFNLHDEPFTQTGGLTTGLMTYEGERKPAFAAYRRAR